jgi:hypothetical protein
VEVVEQTDRPDRKVYHITEAGREELHRWLAGPIPVQEMRSTPLIQIFFASQLSDEELLAKFEYAAGLFRQVLDQYQQVPAIIDEYAREIGTPRDAFCWGLTLELGVKTFRAQLEWAESVIQRIQNKQIPPKR